MTAFNELIEAFRGEGRPEVRIIRRVVGPDGLYTGEEIHSTNDDPVRFVTNAATAGTPIRSCSP